MSFENAPIGRVMVLVMLLIAFFGWGFAAADFFQHNPEGAAGGTNFWINAFVQLPNFFKVLSHTFQNAIWIVIVFSVVELLALGFWAFAKKMEKEMQGRGARR
jgi:hypothetical protein